MHRIEVAETAWRALVAGILVTCALLLCLGGQRAEAAKLDPSFGKGGTAIVEIGNPGSGGPTDRSYLPHVSALTSDGEGRYLAGGGVGERFLVTRLLRDGASDLDFAEAGLGSYENVGGFSGNRSMVRGLFAQSDGRIVAVGVASETNYNSPPHSEVLAFRLLADGGFDPSFWTPPPGSASGQMRYVTNGWAWSVAERPQGGFVVAGAGSVPGSSSQNVGTVTRLGPDAARDSQFGNDDGVFRQFAKKWPRTSEFTQAIPLASGKILVVGNLRRRLVLGRLTATGRWDRSFGPQRRGYVVVGEKNSKGRPCYCLFGQGVAVDARGRFVVAGYAYKARKSDGEGVKRLRLYRFLPNGRLDRSFGRRGRAAASPATHLDVGKIVIGSRGRIFVSGGLGYYPTTRFAVLAFKQNGKPDRSFFGGRYEARIRAESEAEAMLIDSKGRLVVAGGANEGKRSAIVIKRFLVDR